MRATILSLLLATVSLAAVPAVAAASSRSSCEVSARDDLDGGQVVLLWKCPTQNPDVSTYVADLQRYQPGDELGLYHYPYYWNPDPLQVVSTPDERGSMKTNSFELPGDFQACLQRGDEVIACTWP